MKNTTMTKSLLCAVLATGIAADVQASCILRRFRSAPKVQLSVFGKVTKAVNGINWSALAQNGLNCLKTNKYAKVGAGAVVAGISAYLGRRYLTVEGKFDQAISKVRSLEQQVAAQQKALGKLPLIADIRNAVDARTQFERDAQEFEVVAANNRLAELQLQLDNAQAEADNANELAKEGNLTSLSKRISAWFGSSYIKSGIDAAAVKTAGARAAARHYAGAARDVAVSGASKVAEGARSAANYVAPVVAAPVAFVAAAPSATLNAVKGAGSSVAGAARSAGSSVMSAGRSVRDMISANKAVLIASAVVTVMYDVTKKGLTFGYNKLAKRA